jgi:hypothetical protein
VYLEPKSYPRHARACWPTTPLALISRPIVAKAGWVTADAGITTSKVTIEETISQRGPGINPPPFACRPPPLAFRRDSESQSGCRPEPRLVDGASGSGYRHVRLSEHGYGEKVSRRSQEPDPCEEGSRHRDRSRGCRSGLGLGISRRTGSILISSKGKGKGKFYACARKLRA